MGKFIDFIKRLFGRIVGTRVQRGLNNSEAYKKAYENTAQISFANIFAASLSNKAVTDCDMTVADLNDQQSKRTEFIAKALKPVWGDIKKTVNQALGKGGKFLVPYVVGDRVFVDVIDQDHVAITDQNGAGEITSLSIRAEVAEHNNRIFERWMDYELSGGNIIIRQKAVNNGREVPLSAVPHWENISEEIAIGNVDRVLVGYLKCPKDNRYESCPYGVPITYGSDDTIRQLRECLAQIEVEYGHKGVKVFADSTLFGKNEKVGDVFKVFQAGGALDGRPFYEVFDPSIRDASYYTRYNALCGQLEREVGTSAGILTRPENRGTTAYEIKSDNYDTFCLVSDIRKAISDCLEDVAYAVDVYAEYFGLTPAGVAGEYKITFDWDTSLIESSTEKFNQLSELESRGGCSLARLNSFVTGQSMEEAQAEIDAVQEQAAKTVAQVLPNNFEPGEK